MTTKAMVANESVLWMEKTGGVAVLPGPYVEEEPLDLKTLQVTVFLCANCARKGRMPGSLSTPGSLHIEWPCQANVVWVPCAGRIQPEHLLKAIEKGADAACVVACEEDNCHYVQGSQRVAKRVEMVGRMLDEMGLGAERLILCHLPGSARQDLCLGARRACEPEDPSRISEGVNLLQDQVVEGLSAVAPNPFKTQQDAGFHPSQH